MSKVILPQDITIDGETVYVGFWMRLLAFFADTILVIPVILGIQYVAYKLPGGQYSSPISVLIFWILYYVVFVRFFSGTPGKLIARIGIIRNDGQRIGWKESVLRECVTIINYIITSIMLIVLINQIGYDTYSHASFSEKGNLFKLHKSTTYEVFDYFSSAWVFSEFIVLLFNKRKKAIHDYIASTLVIRRKFITRVSDFIKK